MKKNRPNSRPSDGSLAALSGTRAKRVLVEQAKIDQRRDGRFAATKQLRSGPIHVLASKSWRRSLGDAMAVLAFSRSGLGEIQFNSNAIGIVEEELGVAGARHGALAEFDILRL